ncbi:Mor transcription activator family protein [Sapientia aquatica]|uniref:DNA-binding protein n=1 Tax=Sapientia aquatica TaxID=1549640 RepID=A0A4R5W1F0_9BURK|nr:Mor transcription activator family protein [Sapientia aquatica]TDK66011.1 DNA-binding protein [Sapientia aquatica]
MSVTLSRMEQKRHELLSDLASHGTAILIEHGIDDAVADQVATAIADFLAQHWGGQNITIPKDYHFKLSNRDMVIYQEFARGVPYDALAIKFDMTERGMRKLIERVTKREISKRQGKLF